jgi:hypothetical protein
MQDMQSYLVEINDLGIPDVLVTENLKAEARHQLAGGSKESLKASLLERPLKRPLVPLCWRGKVAP